MGVAQPLPCLSGGGLHPAGPVLHRPQLPVRLPQDDPTVGGDSPLHLAPSKTQSSDDPADVYKFYEAEIEG